MEFIFSNAIEQIDAIFDFTLINAANEYWRVDIGNIESDFAETIEEKTTFSLENYFISIDTHCIRHILRQHGNIKTEQNRGQIAIAKRELRFLIKILQTPDLIADAGKSVIGNDCVLLQKKIKEVVFTSIWEIRTVTVAKNKTRRKAV